MRKQSLIPAVLWLSLLAGGSALAQAAGADLPADVRAAIDAKDWRATADLLEPLMASAPSWRGYQALGDARMQLKQYPEAAAAFERGVGLATDDPTARPAARAMQLSEGNAQLGSHNDDAAIALYRQEAADDPNPAVADFDLCAVEYNIGKMADTVGDCDRAIAADPAKADAYFIKGSALFGDTTQVDGKWVGPQGAEAALRKYLELAPDGPHAADAKQMLDMVK